ncbi:MAG: 3-dehydroquinate synthase [Candidatus Diapherotrites archaeon]|nr:3-dehydroquinate synthase [Candidatus Diapherotrites archaeon]
MAVKVRLKRPASESYDIVVGRNLSARAAEFIAKRLKAKKCAIISDSIVTAKFAESLRVQIERKGSQASVISFPAGERSKSLATFALLQQKVFDAGLDRKSCIVALGGGVTGDVAGFAASTFMRGIALVQVPTTLLAMVDSSIGGKTGVDLPNGKNVVGAFKQPSAVFADLDYLNGLPGTELRNGSAEIAKHAVIADAKMFSFLEKNPGFAGKPKLLAKIVEKNAAIKAKIVMADEKESNRRQVLNFGHTVGHAIESLTGYEKFSHGEAVAIGMMVEAKVAQKLGILAAKDADRIIALVESLGFSPALPKFGARELIAEMRRDKKSRDGAIVMALPEKIGRMAKRNGSFGLAVPEKAVIETLNGLM